MVLYQLLSDKQLDKFLKPYGTNVGNEKLVEIMDSENDLYGDFIIVAGYKFKSTFGRWQCWETPTHKHTKVRAGYIAKNPEDRIWK